MHIAVIGTGISGMTIAYLLQPEHTLTVYEASDYIGGHTHTVPVTVDDATYNIDTGFIVFNDWTYPNFIRLMDQLGVESRPTEMSFSVRCNVSNIEYAGTSINTLFAQRRNLLNPSHWRMIYDIVRFNRKAKALLATGVFSGTLGELITSSGLCDAFRDRYLTPMISAIWSADPAEVMDFPAQNFLTFFNNHGLLNINDRPQWRVIKGGSSEYITKLTASYQHKIRLSTPVNSIRRDADGVWVCSQDGKEDKYDQVVLAVHSNQALQMLLDPSEAEKEILSAIPYQDNDVLLHTDSSILPKKHLAWSSWNYLVDKEPDNNRATVTYNMNILQGVDAPVTFCVTLNQNNKVKPDAILGQFQYAHPVYSIAGVTAQKRHAEISGVNNTHYCGAYWGYGFHEDGVKSALEVAKAFGKDWP